ncbi:mucosal addressin cell adhesion molecule 1 [Pteronotus mesoamericanus]|uniref:mucosal addressin cell adhesion molecule 1 n=1 Tax=Pteronotus mesoamericanus TaxID=1884717 RepID=UPI0023EB059D|nr:mucosal addressin cell adhesion molecule 1 [Pteronotus parnellii mesoamericanus]
MEQVLAFLLPLFMGLLQQGRGGLLEVEPRQPVVAVALGGSRQLTCRLACATRAASVQWRGLDTSLGAVQSGAGSSVLTVRNASLSATGTRVCVGSCGNLTFQRTVQLLVFAFPNQLTVSPVALVPGQTQELACTAHNVTPADPEALSLSLLLEDQELEGVQALGREKEEEEVPEEGEDPLFQVTERWRLPPLKTPAPSTLHCQATMRLPGLELSHRRPIPVLNILTSQEPPILTSQEPPILTSQEATLEQDSARSPWSPSPKPGNSSIRPCRPEIRRSPAPGGLELLCEAACGPGTAVHWIQAPGELAAYKRWEAGAQAWLSVLWAGCNPEGWFQCRLDPGGQTASLYLLPEICSPQTSEALWIGSLVLALLLLMFLTYHLWKRCRPTT